MPANGRRDLIRRLKVHAPIVWQRRAPKHVEERNVICYVQWVHQMLG